MTFLSCLPTVLLMAGVTYLIRMLPMALVRGKITSRYINRLLYYIPFAVLSAMTVPAIFTSTGGVIPSLVGCVIGVLLSLIGRSLIEVALAASAAAWIVILIL